MNFFYEVEIPKETQEANPHRETLLVDKGVITNVLIAVLPGHAGLTHLKLYYHEVQIYPHNSESWYKGDGIIIKFPDEYVLDTVPFELVAEGYNEDIRYNHAFLIDINILRGGFTGEQTREDYTSYVGISGE